MGELRVTRGSESFVLRFQNGERLSDLLAANGISLSSPCGGRGVCGKCAVELEGAVSPMNDAERRAGTRLACQAVLLGDARAVLPRERAMEIIETGDTRAMEAASPMPGRYGVAVDIGTTTLAAALYDMESGACLARAGMLNPQSSVAADVMGRIGAAMAQGPDRLRGQVTDAVGSLAEQACSAAGVSADDVKSAVVTGNTTMLYLLTGRDPTPLSRAPFAADCLFGETVRLGAMEAYLPPCMHAFVGADITCALLSSRLCGGDGLRLLCDVGTNGETALWDGRELLVTSTAAGPAFEGAGISCGCGSVRGAIDRAWAEDGQLRVRTIGGAKAVGVCGSGLIGAVATALELGAMDETGAMDGPFRLADGVSLSPKDVRAVQLAKAAIAAGIDTLLESAHVRAEDVGRFCVAGGFGSHMDPAAAAAIGLFPAALAKKCEVLGNASLTGAAMLLTDTRLKDEACRLAGMARHVDLGGNPAFVRHYTDEMFFPETDP